MINGTTSYGNYTDRITGLVTDGDRDLVVACWPIADDVMVVQFTEEGREVYATTVEPTPDSTTNYVLGVTGLFEDDDEMVRVSITQNDDQVTLEIS